MPTFVSGIDELFLTVVVVSDFYLIQRGSTNHKGHKKSCFIAKS